jgi:MFS family permease
VTQTSISSSGLRHVMLAAGVGSALEWYDFFIYGLASALVFGKLFFPNEDPVTGTLVSFATFGVGFLARPFGGLFFGHFGDRWGRKPVLVASLVLVGGGTFLIGLLPTYSQAGIWAPVMLTALRLLQGFGAGAEYTGAVVMAVEFAPPGKRGLYGAFAPMGTQTGLAAAAATFWLVQAMGQDALLSWGWRVPFLISLLLLGLGLYIRTRISETPVFQQTKRAGQALRIPALEAIRRYPRNFLVVVGARMAENALGYLYPVFGISYLTETLHVSRNVAMTGLLVGSAALVVGVLFFCWLSDRIGRRPVYIFGALFSAACVFPFFWLANSRDPLLIILGFVVTMGIGVSAMFGPQAAYFAELFGPRLRYSGFAFAREVGSILAGGPAPLLAGLLVNWMTGQPWGVCWYVIGLCAVTIVAVWCGPETHTSDIGTGDSEGGECPAPSPSLILHPAP